MKKYSRLLIEQFRQATGAKSIDINSQLFISEYNSWLETRQSYGKSYLDLLNYMELYNISNRNIAEIGKGIVDTIVKDLDTTIITPYSDGIVVSDPKRIITSEFKIYKDMPILVKTNKKGKTIMETAPSTIQTFMTQNPYTIESIYDWEKLHNTGEKNIIVGIYGSVYDKDIERKVKQLKDLRNKLTGDYKEEYSTVNHTYSYALASNKEAKKLLKVLKK